MSLKAFHIVFILVSITMSLFVGIWGVQAYVQRRDEWALGLGAACFVMGLLLVIYSQWFLRKIRAVEKPR